MYSASNHMGYLRNNNGIAMRAIDFDRPSAFIYHMENSLLGNSISTWLYVVS
jgi:hypothetical protein